MCLLQANTVEAGSKQDAVDAAAPSAAMSELMTRQKVQKYRCMAKHWLDWILRANGLPAQPSDTKDELISRLIKFDDLLTGDTDSRDSCARQAADAYIAWSVSLPVLGSTVEQQTSHYSQFEVHELQGLCRQHGLDASFHFKDKLIRTLIAGEDLLRANEAELNSRTQHDADAIFIAHSTFPAIAIEATYEKRVEFWDLLSHAQLAAICIRQGLLSADSFNTNIRHPPKPFVIKSLINSDCFKPAAGRLGNGRQDAAAATDLIQPSAGFGRSAETHVLLAVHDRASG